jgi:hypothetical protein
MIRRVLALAIAVCLAPAGAAAQTTVLTINAARAEVRTSPSVGSPVVGEAPRGTVLEVTRQVGDWVKVSWPDGPEGVGYVRRSLGSLAGTMDPPPNRAAGIASARPAPEADSPSAMSARAEVQDVERRIFANGHALEYVTPPANSVGFGGLVNGSTIGFGASGRVWSRRGLGVQVEMSRYSQTAAPTGSQVVSVQFAPSVVYSLTDRLTDYVRLRPYVGGGPRWWSSTLHAGANELISEKRRSWQVFGGTELTFASAPRFALSADLRYDSSDTPFAGITFGGLGFSASGHWYVR